jgi:hypothetical protein
MVFENSRVKAPGFPSWGHGHWHFIIYLGLNTSFNSLGLFLHQTQSPYSCCLEKFPALLLYGWLKSSVSSAKRSYEPWWCSPVLIWYEEQLRWKVLLCP